MYRNLTKNNIISIAATALIAVGLLCVIVSQQASAQVPPATPAGGSTFEQRVKQRTAERNVVISETDQKRSATTCINAQTKLRALQQKTTPVIAKRATIDQQVDGKLWIMIGKLKVGGVDTFDLEKQRATLAGKVDAMHVTAANYSQALDDVVVVDCKANPAGFKSLLETARIYHTQLRDQSNGVRAFINEDVKNSLNSYSEDLKSKSASEGTE